MTPWIALLLWGALRVTAVAVAAMLGYLLLWRSGPRVRHSIALAGLLVAAALLPLACLPGPRWMVERAELPRAAPLPEQFNNTPSAIAAPPLPATAALSATAGSLSEDDTRVAAAAWAAFTQALLDPEPLRPTADTTAGHWPRVLLWVMAGAITVGLLRLLVGLWLVRRCVRAARPLGDAALAALVNELRGELGCGRAVALRESSRIATAATAGLLHPTILLPPEWRTWTPPQRRAVLAHELAHICRSDYAIGCVAQALLAVNFYHPLLHWLSGRVRLEQELAADALAATVSGGRTAYLRTLAELSLRCAESHVAWPARAFLPSHGTLLRRIEMLRNPHAAADRSRPLLRAGLVAGLLSLGVLLAGLGPNVADAQSVKTQATQTPVTESGTRGVTLPTAPPITRLVQTRPAAPGAPAANQTPADQLPAADPKPLGDQTQPGKPAALAFLPAEAFVALVARPRAALELPELQPIVGQLDRMLTNPADLRWQALATAGVTPGNIDEVAAGMVLAEPNRVRVGVVFRLVTPLDTAALVPPYAPPRPVLGGMLFDSDVLPVIVVDDHTLVMAETKELAGAMVLNGAINASRSVWPRLDNEVGRPHLGLLANIAAARPLVSKAIEAPNGPGAQLALMLGPFMPLLDDANTAGLGVRLDAAPSVKGYVSCGDPAAAARVAQTLRALITLSGNTMRQFSQTMLPQANTAEKQQIGQLMKTANTLLSSMQVQAEQQTVRLTANLGDGANTAAMVVGSLLPALQQAQAASQRTVSMNNLKQIGLAFHNYHDTYGFFPPAVTVENGVERSWRVELLPFLEQNALYSLYRKNEAWDSEANLQVLAQMPKVFHDPADTVSDANSASYFALVGPGTVFDHANKPEGVGTEFRDITDGSSNTILTVEARRNIPWTKPEDIPFDPKQTADLAKALGGNHPGGFLTGFADGSVRFLSESITPELLKGYATRNGGELTP